eukprot:338360-Lingulodinium_polyedra.AAC.1
MLVKNAMADRFFVVKRRPSKRTRANAESIAKSVTSEHEQHGKRNAEFNYNTRWHNVAQRNALDRTT